MYAFQMIGWIVCGIYATIPAFWLIIHPFADYWRKRFRAPLKFLGLIWIVLWIFSWVMSSPWRYAMLPLSAKWSLIALPFWAVSVFIYFGGQRHFSINQVIGRAELEADRHPQILITTGLHGRMRHPLYFGHLCTMLGWLAIARTQAILGLLVVAIVTGAFMLRAEDAELEARFGEAYREYRTRVPSVIPRL
jgi:protein-S-isoprenylcysteine O-methyltransferase Ste14